jgi:hypothetical protein
LENFPGAGAIIVRCPFARSRHVVPPLSHQAARFLAIALRPYILFSPSRSFLSFPSAAEQEKTIQLLKNHDKPIILKIVNQNDYLKG